MNTINGTSGSPPASSTKSKSPFEAIEDLTQVIQLLTDRQQEMSMELQATQRQFTQLSNSITAGSTMNEQLSELVALQRRMAESLAGDDFRRELKTLTGATASLTKTSSSVVDRSDAELQKVTGQLAGLRAEVIRVKREVSELERATTGQLAGPLQRAEALVDRVDRLSSWSLVLGGRLLAGAVMLLISLGTVSGVLWGFAGLLGVPEVAGAVWAAFEATETWWVKGLWAAAGIMFACSIGYGAWRLLRWMVEALR